MYRYIKASDEEIDYYEDLLEKLKGTRYSVENWCDLADIVAETVGVDVIKMYLDGEGNYCNIYFPNEKTSTDEPKYEVVTFEEHGVQFIFTYAWVQETDILPHAAKSYLDLLDEIEYGEE